MVRFYRVLFVSWFPGGVLLFVFAVACSLVQNSDVASVAELFGQYGAIRQIRLYVALVPNTLVSKSSFELRTNWFLFFFPLQRKQKRHERNSICYLWGYFWCQKCSRTSEWLQSDGQVCCRCSMSSVCPLSLTGFCIAVSIGLSCACTIESREWRKWMLKRRRRRSQRPKQSTESLALVNKPFESRLSGYMHLWKDMSICK